MWNCNKLKIESFDELKKYLLLKDLEKEFLDTIDNKDLYKIIYSII